MHYLVAQCPWSQDLLAMILLLLLLRPTEGEGRKLWFPICEFMIVWYEYVRIQEYVRACASCELWVCGFSNCCARFIYCFIRFSKPYHQQWSPRHRIYGYEYHALVFVCCGHRTISPKTQYIPSISVCVCDTLCVSEGAVRSMDDDDESILSVFIGPSQINGFSNTYVIQLDSVSE